MIQLRRLSPNKTFLYNGLRLTVIRHEGAMTEVIDANQKYWAWPSTAKVKV